jgi:TRAP-type C4-dicarboxylate transport system substrate-binding protein
MRGAGRAFVGAGAALAMLASASGQTIDLRIVGGLAGVRQFQQFEEPFWTREIGPLTGGRVSATIHPHDRSGLRGQDMLQLMRLGVVPFGTMPILLAAADEPELGAVDLPGLNPDIDALRRTVAAYRGRLAATLKERHGIELLGVYAYPAQSLFCKAAFRGLDDLAGRRIRTSSFAQSQMVEAFGGVPVITAFSEIVGAINRNVVDCAITGTLSGHQIGLSEVTTHVHTMAISWGLTMFGANAEAWRALPEDVRTALGRGVGALEGRIWLAAERDTALGLDCAAGRPSCPDGKRGRMTVVEASEADAAALRRAMAGAVIPGWIERCGLHCVAVWNGSLAATAGVALMPDGRPQPVADAGQRAPER